MPLVLLLHSNQILGSRQKSKSTGQTQGKFIQPPSVKLSTYFERAGSRKLKSTIFHPEHVNTWDSRSREIFNRHIWEEKEVNGSWGNLTAPTLLLFPTVGRRKDQGPREGMFLHYCALLRQGSLLSFIKTEGMGIKCLSHVVGKICSFQSQWALPAFICISRGEETRAIDSCLQSPSFFSDKNGQLEDRMFTSGRVWLGLSFDSQALPPVPWLWCSQQAFSSSILLVWELSWVSLSICPSQEGQHITIFSSLLFHL